MAPEDWPPRQSDSAPGWSQWTGSQWTPPFTDSSARPLPAAPMDRLNGLGSAAAKDRRLPRAAVELGREIVREAAATAARMGVEIAIEDALDDEGSFVTRIRMTTARGSTSVDVIAAEAEHWADAWRRAFRELGLLD